MKKTLALLLVLVLCIGMCACGNGGSGSSASKEELLAVAEECSATDIQNASIENIVTAKDAYCNKTLLLEGTVRTINEDHIEMSAMYSANYIIDVYLPVEEIAVLKSGQYITVVGNTTDEIVEASENVAEFTFDYSHYQMPVAYLVEDTIEITGVLKGVNTSYDPAFNIQIGDSNVLRLVYFADGVDTSSFEFNQEISFSAKAIYEGDFCNYYDAQVIE